MTLQVESKPKRRSLAGILGIIGSIVVIVGGIVGTLVTLHIVNPPTPVPTPTATVAPTATPSFAAFTDPHLSCLKDPTTGDLTVEPANPWKLSDSDKTDSTYACVAVTINGTASYGTRITQRPHSPIISGLYLPLPLKGDPLTRNYSTSVQISILAPSQSCVGMLFRYTTHAYGMEICRSGEWVFSRFNGASGVPSPLAHGPFVVSDTNSYLLSLEVSNDKASFLIGGQSLPDMNLDPSFQESYFGLFVDGADPLNPYPSSTTDNPNNPGASATFTDFVYQPNP